MSKTYKGGGGRGGCEVEGNDSCSGVDSLVVNVADAGTLI